MGCTSSANTFNEDQTVTEDHLGGIFSDLMALTDVDEDENECTHHPQKPIKYCIYLTRLKKGLRYYMAPSTDPNEIHNTSKRDAFIRFCMTEYTELINDYAHLVVEHSSDLFSIHNRLITRYGFKKCELSECSQTARHQSYHDKNSSDSSIIRDEKHEEDEALFNFYVETYDSLHYYLFHLFDVGLRSEDIKINETVTESTQIDNIQHLDEKFKIMQDMIKKKKSKTSTKGIYKNNKFNIDNAITSVGDILSELDAKGNTFIESMLLVLVQNEVSNDVLRELQIYIEQEEYNTDTILDDLEQGAKHSNIAHHIASYCGSNINDHYVDTSSPTRRRNSSRIKPYHSLHSATASLSPGTNSVALATNDVYALNNKAEDCFQCMTQYITHMRLSKQSFSSGFIFYYWPYYKNMMQDKEENEIAIAIDESNINDHSGYSLHELYVEQKYSCFKEEILNSEYVSIEDYDERIHLKAKLYLNSAFCKSIKANRIIDNNGIDDVDLHYDIKQGAALQMNNIISLILYCDFTKLSKEFSSTFRPNMLNESLESIKKRNQKFWWLSKILRETVQYYGDKGGRIQFTDIYSPVYGVHYEIKGPFYCGMSREMVLPEFNIRLCAPTSTSAQIEVATSFSGDDGIIIQLNNSGDIYSSFHLRSFDCHWLSKYKEEDERLFFGGEWRIRIESIRIMRTHQNFADFFEVLFHFDCMIEGVYMGSYSKEESVRLLALNSKKQLNVCTQDGKNLLRRLMNNDHDVIEEEQSDNFGMDPYIIDTWNLFCLQKTQIILNLHYIWRHFYKISDLILYSVRQDWAKKRKDDLQNEEKKNIFRPELYSLFTNIKRIIIYSNYLENVRKVISYSLSLMQLVSALQYCSNSLQEIVIKASWRRPFTKWKRSWLFAAYTKYKDEEERSQHHNHYNDIVMNITTDKDGNKEDCVTISIY